MKEENEDKALIEQVEPRTVRIVDRDRIQIEFLIDDLVKQLIKDRVSPVAACNGCNACSASAEVVKPVVRR